MEENLGPRISLLPEAISKESKQQSIYHVGENNSLNKTDHGFGGKNKMTGKDFYPFFNWLYPTLPEKSVCISRIHPFC